MRPIQFILIPLLITALLFFTPRLRRTSLLQLLFVLAASVLIVFVIFPDWSTVVANAVGIGRGVDLITYLGLLSLSISHLLHLLKIRKLEDRLVSLARNIAVREEKASEKENEN